MSVEIFGRKLPVYMYSRWIAPLFLMILLTGCSAPRVAPTGTALTSQVATATPLPLITQVPVTNSPVPAPTPDVAVGASFIGTFQGGKLTFLHVSIGASNFFPETIEILETSTKEIVAGPFLLKKNGSELCGGRYYDSEGIGVSELPENFRVQVSSPPYYTFRVTGHRFTGEEVSREIVTTAQFTCENTNAPLVIGTSLVEYESAGKDSEFYLHINVLDKNGGFVPTFVEIIDPNTGQEITNPLQITDKYSELCYGEGYETENIFPLLTNDHYLRPDYMYRISLSNTDGQEIKIDVNQDPYVCRNELR